MTLQAMRYRGTRLALLDESFKCGGDGGIIPPSIAPAAHFPGLPPASSICSLKRSPPTWLTMGRGTGRGFVQCQNDSRPPEATY